MSEPTSARQATPGEQWLRCLIGWHDYWQPSGEARRCRWCGQTEPLSIIEPSLTTWKKGL